MEIDNLLPIIILNHNQNEKATNVDSSLSRRKEATRTPDPYVPNVVRYQLRYFPKQTLFLFAGAKVQCFYDITKKKSFFYHI